MPDPVLARMDWYWTRIWVAVTPLRAMWWDDDDLSVPPRTWTAPEGTTAPPSDPAPAGPAPGSWSPFPVDWRARTDGVLRRLGLPVLTTIDATGWPLPVPVRSAEPTGTGFRVHAPAGVVVVPGPANLTFHTHADVFDGQENVSLVGVVTGVDSDGSIDIRIDRALADWGLSRNPLRTAWSMFRAGRRLRPRLRAEAARRQTTLPRFADLDLD
jgi:hypothetical protein